MSSPDPFDVSAGPAAEAGLGSNVDLVIRPQGPSPEPGAIGCSSPAAEPPYWTRRAAVAAIAAAPFAFWMSRSRGEQSLEPVEHHSFHLPPEGPRLPAPRGVSFSGDRLFILDDIGRVLVYRGAELLQKWWMPEYSVGRPEGIRMLQDGRIVVADTHYHRLVFFHPDGTVESLLGGHGEGPLQFIYTVGLIQDPDGFIYVSEYGGHDRVQKLTPQGEFVLEFGRSGTAPGEFQRPSGILWRDGEILISDAINNRIQVFSTTGKFLRILADAQTADLHYPYNICSGPAGELAVIEYGAGRLTILSAAGQVLGRFGHEGRGRGQFWTPWGVACDAGSRIAVADTGNRRVVQLKFT